MMHVPFPRRGAGVGHWPSIPGMCTAACSRHCTPSDAYLGARESTVIGPMHSIGESSLSTPRHSTSTPCLIHWCPCYPQVNDASSPFLRAQATFEGGEAIESHWKPPSATPCLTCHSTVSNVSCLPLVSQFFKEGCGSFAQLERVCL